MAVKKAKKEKPKYACRDCTHSYDWHEKNWQGELFMCRCPHYKEGKFSKFLDDPQCDKFELRNNGSKEQIGCQVERLWNLKLSGGNTYKGRLCTISREPIFRMKQNTAPTGS